MAANFFHGVEIVTLTVGPRVVRISRTGVIGIVGTAPAADADAFPLNEPVLINGSLSGLSALGKTGTLPLHLKAMTDQSAPVIMVVRVEEGADEAATLANVQGSAAEKTGVHALKKCGTKYGYQPFLLCAPGFTHQRDAAKNAIANELVLVADNLRGFAFVDLPTDFAAAQTYRGDFGSKRIYGHSGRHLISFEGETVPVYASAVICGHIARVHNDFGWWFSPSNHEMNILGVEEPVYYSDTDPASEANLFNEKDIACTIRDDGYRLWGNTSFSSDRQFSFLSIAITHDVLFGALKQAIKEQVDRPIVNSWAEDIAETANVFFRFWKSREAIIDANCAISDELTIGTQIQEGNTYFNIDWAGAYPAQRIQMQTAINNGYLEELF
ncbi:phage tail sheath subtilisin-like domain-containing protein [Pseudovibrio ascidiaceicola]|uniref:phage tail sheath subtilisin-like domain-containing protein n=1 Tax=Pseudovibrio ascidiaceicola TaxID=285279 RepID=UPI003D35DC73